MIFGVGAMTCLHTSRASCINWVVYVGSQSIFTPHAADGELPAQNSAAQHSTTTVQHSTASIMHLFGPEIHNHSSAPIDQHPVISCQLQISKQHHLCPFLHCVGVCRRLACRQPAVPELPHRMCMQPMCYHAGNVTLDPEVSTCMS